MRTAGILAFGATVAIVTTALAEGPPCGWNPTCTNPESVGAWVPYSCDVAGAGARCRIIERRMIDCGNYQGWEFRFNGTGGAVPCSEDCTVNAHCVPPSGGGGGG